MSSRRRKRQNRQLGTEYVLLLQAAGIGFKIARHGGLNYANQPIRHLVVQHRVVRAIRLLPALPIDKLIVQPWPRILRAFAFGSEAEVSAAEAEVAILASCHAELVNTATIGERCTCPDCHGPRQLAKVIDFERLYGNPRVGK